MFPSPVGVACSLGPVLCFSSVKTFTGEETVLFGSRPPSSLGAPRFTVESHWVLASGGAGARPCWLSMGLGPRWHVSCSFQPPCLETLPFQGTSELAARSLFPC